MVEQLFTARSEEKGNGKERREQLFAAADEAQSSGKDGAIVYWEEGDMEGR